MSFRAFFWLSLFLMCGSAAMADVVVENKSATDTLYVAAVFGNSDGANANGFWTIPPQSNAVLLSDATPQNAIWLRVAIKRGSSKAHELFPVGAARIRISPQKCAWNNAAPQLFVCEAEQRFLSMPRSFAVTMGTAETAHHMRGRLLDGRAYEFFQVKPNQEGRFHWTWN